MAPMLRTQRAAVAVGPLTVGMPLQRPLGVGASCRLPLKITAAVERVGKTAMALLAMVTLAPTVAEAAERKASMLRTVPQAALASATAQEAAAVVVDVRLRLRRLAELAALRIS